MTEDRRLTTDSFRPKRHRRGLDTAVAAVALLVRDNGFEEMAPSEIRPERFGDPDLGVRDLPEQEVADAHFTAGANQQIGIRLARRVEQIAEPALVQILGAKAFGDGATRRIDDFRAAAVVER